jgi:hypothetical protein
MVCILLFLCFFVITLVGVCCYIWRGLFRPPAAPQVGGSLVKMPPKRPLTEEKVKQIEEKQIMQQHIVEVRPPEIERLDKLTKDFTWDGLVAIGDIYRAGAYPRFLPNEDLALECYKVAAMGPDGEIAGIAQAKYMDLRMNPIDDVDKAGKHLPTFYGEQACRVAMKEIQNMSYSLFEKPKYRKSSIKGKDVPARHSTTLVQVETQNENEEDLYNFLETVQRSNNHNTSMTLVPTPQYYSDSQNVHDHSVVKTVKKNIDALSHGNTPNYKTASIKDRVRNSILNSDISEEDKYNALQVVDSLNETSKHSSFDVTESDALGMVWSKIQTHQGKEKENLEEMLSRQLASGVEHGNVVCSTGKIARILGSFDGVTNDGIEQVKPMYAVKEEIAGLAVKVRDRYEGSMSTAEMQNAFEKEVYKEYVDKLGMSASVVDPIVSVYKEGF